MNFTEKFFAPGHALLLGLFALHLSSASLAEEYFDRYGLTPASAPLDLGTQPLGYPSGVISAVMQHDRILKKALVAAGTPLQTHAFRRGADMLKPLADQRLEAGLLGDMPSILAAVNGNIWIVGLVKQTSTAIVAKKAIRVGDLAGKRIGYVEASSAHHTLLQGLSSAGLRESDVQLMAMGVDAMPDALEQGQIDAFAAWEPGPSIALGNNAENHIVFRGLSSDYFVIEQTFAKRAPQATDALIAGYLRAIYWMRRAQKNVETAARWAIADTEAMSGKASALSFAKVASITRRDILSIPSAPAILSHPDLPPPLKSEFEFLKDRQKIPAGVAWENVQKAFEFDGLARIMANLRAHQVNLFDYEE